MISCFMQSGGGVAAASCSRPRDCLNNTVTFVHSTSKKEDLFKKFRVSIPFCQRNSGGSRGFRRDCAPQILGWHCHPGFNRTLLCDILDSPLEIDNFRSHEIRRCLFSCLYFSLHLSCGRVNYVQFDNAADS